MNRMDREHFLHQIVLQLEYYQFKVLNYDISIVHRKEIRAIIRHLRGAYLIIGKEI